MKKEILKVGKEKFIFEIIETEEEKKVIFEKKVVVDKLKNFNDMEEVYRIISQKTGINNDDVFGVFVKSLFLMNKKRNLTKLLNEQFAKYLENPEEYFCRRKK